MKIGIDLDGVLYDTERMYRTYSELYDTLELKQNSKVNNKEILLQNRFNWNKEQVEDFFRRYHEEIVCTANIMPGAKKVLEKLKKDGHKLYIITARGSMKNESKNNLYFDSVEVTKKRLKEENLDKLFEKCIFNKARDKDKVCKEEGIDLMIDDSYSNCMSLAEQKIKVLYLKDAPSYDIENNKYVTTVYNWGEIYRYIYEK